MTLLAIDPGACTGFAVFSGGFLIFAAVTAVDDDLSFEWENCEEMIIEVPQVYRAALSKGDPNDLIKVAIEVGQWKERARIAGCPKVTWVKPATWKGQVEKSIHHARAMKVLSEEEKRAIPNLPATKLHNLMDAVALGLWHLKRLR